MASNLDIRQITGGPLETNAFLVIDRSTTKALLIDAPPGTHDAIVAAVTDRGASVTSIILTHTHWDHIVDTDALRASLGAPVIVHPNADARLARPGSSVMELPYSISPITPDGHVEDGDEVVTGESVFSVMFLPGHDPSHIALYNADGKVLLGGDVLFPGGHGRTDIPDADEDSMRQSLARLLELPDDVTVYPGHGRETTIGTERGWMTGMTASI